MKAILLISLLLFTTPGKAQVRTFYGRVVDIDGKGIPYAAIEADDRLEGFLCLENGTFSFEANPDSVKTFIFYSMGYERKKIMVKKLPLDSIIVHLSPGYYNLEEETITADKKRKSREHILGKKNLHHNGGSYMLYGDEVAIYLNANPERKGFLKEIYVYITDQGIPTTKFRVHVYQKDATNIFPSSELTDNPIIAQAAKGNEWVKVDVSNERISTGNGIFISVEWLTGNGNDSKRIPFTEHAKYYIAGSGASDPSPYINGQVLGMTWNYGIQSITFESSHKKHDSWDYINPYAKKIRHGVIRMSHWINPMIYCTYRYAE